jgi:hypothetical protein
MIEVNRPPHLRLVNEEDDLDGLLIREDELPLQPPPRTAKRRQFRRFDETWAAQLLASDPPVSPAVWRLALVWLKPTSTGRSLSATRSRRMPG